MVPEFFTDYKFSTYLQKLSDRCEALVKKQKLVRDIRVILNSIYIKQVEIAKLGMYGGISTELFKIILLCWSIKLSAQRKLLYFKLKKLSLLDDRVFMTPKSHDLNTLIMKVNYVCDRARLKLTISLPPGAGKTLISTMLAIWVIGLEDNYIYGSIMRNSYSADMAEEMSYLAREFIKSEKYSYIFPLVALASDRKSKKGWAVSGATELTYFGSGPGGSVSGKRAKTLAIYDDFCKGMKEALSAAELNDTWLFYNSVHIKRMISGTAELIIGTRYVKSDLIGRVLDKQSELWETIKVPALKTVINENDEEVERSFCEEVRTTQEYIYEREITDAVIWNAVSMQEPISDEGLLFAKDSLQYFSIDELHDINYKIGFCDTADEGVDYLAAVILASKQPCYRDLEWKELINKYEMIKNWDKDWYKVNKYSEVFIDVKELPQNDVRIPPDLMKKLILKFRMSSNFYLVDVVFSQRGVDFTTPDVVNMIIDHNPNKFVFESNKEGSSYSREVGNAVKGKCYTLVDAEYEGANKVTRMMNSAPRIKRYIYFRNDYKAGSQYEKFMTQLTDIIRLQKNQPDDSGDVLSLAAKTIFTLSDKFFDILDVKEKEKKPVLTTKYGAIDERQYRIYDRLRNFKEIELLRLDYIEIMRDYIVNLLDVFWDNEKLKNYVISEIHRLDMKFHGELKEIKVNGKII
jgi:predicted phage terminase large subunit-like protein